jgi:ribonuclease HI
MPFSPGEQKTPWTNLRNVPRGEIHVWTDGSCKKAAGLGWISTPDPEGLGAPLAQGKRSIETKQTAFEAEVAAIEDALRWFNTTYQPALVVHCDSTGAITRAGHTGAGSGQGHAIEIFRLVSRLTGQGRAVAITWVKGHSGAPGNEQADVLAGEAAKEAGPATAM